MRGLKVGDIIQAYVDGLHVITKFELRDGYEPIVWMKKLCHPGGVPVKGKPKQHSCSILWCHKASTSAIKELEATIACAQQLIKDINAQLSN